MANATVLAKLVPKTTVGNIDTLAAAVDAVAGTDTVTVDRGVDGVVSIDLLVDDASLATAQGVVTTVLGTVTTVERLPIEPNAEQQDPTLAASGVATLDISNGNVIVVELIATLFGSKEIKTVTLTTTDFSAVGIPVVVRGNPQGHDSQKIGQKDRVVLTIGPAPTGAEVGSPHDIIWNVTDENGRSRSSALTTSITCQV